MVDQADKEVQGSAKQLFLNDNYIRPPKIEEKIENIDYLGSESVCSGMEDHNLYTIGR
jgi:hypothetical protein